MGQWLEDALRANIVWEGGVPAPAPRMTPLASRAPTRRQGAPPRAILNGPERGFAFTLSARCHRILARTTPEESTP